MKSSKIEEDENVEENIIKNVINLFRLKKLKKETNNATIKGMSNLSRWKIYIQQLNAEYWMTLKIFLGMKKKIIINQ